mmetsp:Transcript_44754/g.139226  ORF Transcript_44754/g.139226 Transcript_44754/m.139226 type:complete len:126 (+) Transcript_44754:184-561(+)
MSEVGRVLSTHTVQLPSYAYIAENYFPDMDGDEGNEEVFANYVSKIPAKKGRTLPEDGNTPAQEVASSGKRAPPPPHAPCWHWWQSEHGMDRDAGDYVGESQGCHAWGSGMASIDMVRADFIDGV